MGFFSDDELRRQDASTCPMAAAHRENKKRIAEHWAMVREAKAIENESDWSRRIRLGIC